MNSKELAILFILSISITYLFARDPKPKPPPLMCYNCTSDLLPECAQNPASPEITFRNCSHFREECIIAVVDGVTYRGCTGEVNLPIGAKYWLKCNDSLCNDDLYPPGRRKCYQCSSGEECVNPPKDDIEPIPCVNFDEHEECFTDVIDKTDAVRGCKSDTNYEPGPAAQFCKYNGCNNEPGIEILQCRSCSSNDNARCIRDPLPGKNCSIPLKETCRVEQLLGRPPETCFTYNKRGQVIRGCTRYANELQTEEDYFHTCDGDICNYKCIETMKCIECDSKTNANCTEYPETLDPQECENDVTTCFTCFHHDDSVRRGCGKPPSTTDATCYECQEESSCNVNESKSCYNCTSETDPNCAQWTNVKENGNINIEKCPYEEDKCVTYITAEGYTVRGCLKEMNNCESEEFCQKCNTSLCNGDIFPEDRKLCHQCRNENDCKLERTDYEPIPCTFYQKHDACYASYSEKTDQMIRGCRSDGTFEKMCSNSEKKCVTCREKDGCNLWSFDRDSNLSCIKCNSKTDPECGWLQKTHNAEKCLNKIRFDQNVVETCYSYRNKTDNTVIRGCTLEDAEDDALETCDGDDEDEHCIYCTQIACNVEQFFKQTCFQCQSDLPNEENCVNLTGSSIIPKECSYTRFYEDRGCYVRRIKNSVKRGCATDLNFELLDECRFEKSNACQFCENPNCNNMDMPNRSNNLFSLNSFCIIMLSIKVGMCLLKF